MDVRHVLFACPTGEEPDLGRKWSQKSSCLGRLASMGWGVPCSLVVRIQHMFTHCVLGLNSWSRN